MTIASGSLPCRVNSEIKMAPQTVEPIFAESRVDEGVVNFLKAQ